MAIKTGLIGNVNLEKWGDAKILGAYYIDNGRQAIRIANDDGVLITLTVNLPGEPIPSEGDIFVKMWSENEEIARELLEKRGDIFKDTGRRVPSGWVEASIWKFNATANLDK